jgi:HAE1 family hydrophobic/amphiphilic exporter-1
MTLMEWTVFPLFDLIIMRFMLQTYLLILKWLLGAGWRRWTYVILMMALFFGSFKFLPPMEFFPRMDRGIFVVHFEPPEGTSVEKTDDIAKQMEGILNGFPEVDKLLTNVKMGEGNITVVMVPKEKRTRSLPDSIQAVRAKLEQVPGYRTMAFQEPKMGGPHGGKAIQVEVSGDDFTVIRKICKSVAAAIKDVPGLKDLDDGVKEGRPEIKVEFDREKIRDLGVDLFTIANMTRSFIYGSLAGKYKESNEEYDIRVEGADADKNEIAKLRTLELPLEKEKSVPLNQIAKVFEGKGLSKVDRKNLKRILSVQADIEGRVLQSVMDDVRQRLKGLALPAGYEISFGGEDEEMKESFGNLGIALLASILLVYMIMASQYESFLDPFIIMFTIPLSFIGVVAVLRLTGFAFSITAMIGIIMLGGIVVNNGIILVEYINQRRATLKEDSITACVKSGELRYRAIWMTVSTTVLGMLPLGLGVGAGSDFYQPLALTVMGGLTVSTILTLTYIPVLYVIVDDIATAIKKAVGELI